MFGRTIEELLPIILVIGLVIVILYAVRQFNSKRDEQHDEMVSAIESAKETTLPTSPEDRLAELDSLRDSGAVSDEEYEAKRREILDSI